MKNQNIVVRISNLDNKKIRAEAMKIVAKEEGVTLIAVKGDNKLMVTGKVDSVEMTRRLRKKLGFVEVLSVNEIKEEQNTEDDNDNSIIPHVQHPFSPHYYSYYPQYL